MFGIQVKNSSGDWEDLDGVSEGNYVNVQGLMNTLRTHHPEAELRAKSDPMGPDNAVIRFSGMVEVPKPFLTLQSLEFPENTISYKEWEKLSPQDRAMWKIKFFSVVKQYDMCDINESDIDGKKVDMTL